MATIIVDQLGDDAAAEAEGMTLREAVAFANAGDTIEFDPSLAGQTIQLDGARIEFFSDLTINGDIDSDGRADITVAVEQTFDSNNGLFSTVVNSAMPTINLHGLNLVNGSVNPAIFVAQHNTFNISNCTITGNGAGIVNLHGGTVDIQTSAIIDNNGGVANYGDMTIHNTTFHDNEGTDAFSSTTVFGNIYTEDGTLSLSQVTMTGQPVLNGTSGPAYNLHVESGTVIVSNSIIGGTHVSAPDFYVYDIFVGDTAVMNDLGGNVVGGNLENVFGPGATNPSNGFYYVGFPANNGGPVPTVALVNDPSNPALDVGTRTGAGANGVSGTDIAGAGNEGSDFGDAGAYELLCFAAGTRIATPGREVAVEALQEGDLVRTQDGRDVPVLWIGVQTVDAVRALNPRLTPVLIRESAFGEAPTRDLIVTADHGLVHDGYVINASCFVGQPGIDWASPKPRTFYHIETKAHEVLLANGLPAESFCDVAGRRAFDNHADAQGRIIPEMPLPRISSKRLLGMSPQPAFSDIPAA